MSLRFVTDLDAAGVTTPDGLSRSVYEAGGSDVRHFPEADVLTAELGGVRLHADLGAGVTHIASSSFSGRWRYVAAHPFTTLALLEMLKRHERYFLHAACLSRGGRAVVIAGTAGAGKSTLALGLARAGLDYLGDDMVFLRDDDDTVRALGFSDAIGVTATDGSLASRARVARRSGARGGLPEVPRARGGPLRRSRRHRGHAGRDRLPADRARQREPARAARER